MDSAPAETPRIRANFVEAPRVPDPEMSPAFALFRLVALAALLAWSGNGGRVGGLEGPKAMAHAPARGLSAEGQRPGGPADPRLPIWALASPWADSVLASLSVEEKIGQLFMVAAYSNRGPEHEAELRRLVTEQKVGGLIWFQGGPVRQVNWTNRLQLLARVPLLVGQDAEWGPSMRLDSTVLYPRQLGMGAIADDRVLYRFGAEVARQLKLTGVQINFAPVVDVNNNPRNPVIGDRSFGEDRLNVALKGLAYMEGMQDQGVLACGKHFPGHGDTDVDSHHGLPVIGHGWRRLDSLELYPFKVLMSQGLASVMTAHLHIPALDSTANRAASVSPAITGAVLRDSLGFNGLAVTDALNMQGVAAHYAPGELEVAAFAAGNDILLFPEDVPAAARALKAAFESGRLDAGELDRRVRRILQAKDWAGLDDWAPLPTDSLAERLDLPRARRIRDELCRRRLTLARNANDLLPFRSGDSMGIALLDLGRGTPSVFQQTLRGYGEFEARQLPANAGAAAYEEALDQLGSADVVVLGLHGMSRWAHKAYGLSDAQVDFAARLARRTRVVLVLFGTPYALERFPDARHVLVAYDEFAEGQRAAARALFGQQPLRGRLPVSAGAAWPLGSGMDLAAARLRPAEPGGARFPEASAARIDSIVERALALGATPGCRVLVALDGQLVYDKAFGHHTDAGREPVRPGDVYDLASVTKVAATTLAVMRLYEQGRLDLDATVGDYLPELAGSNAGGCRLRDVLAHRARLQPWVPFYQYTLLEDGRRDPSVYGNAPDALHPIEVAEGLWMSAAWQDSILRRIAEAPLRTRAGYKYSDLGFYLLRRVVERLSGEPFDAYLERAYYRRMGLRTMGFRPLERFPAARVVPTERDAYWRHQLLRGYVHDMGAAMMGGVEGHAGLFSDARDLAALFQMLLNGGVYGGHRFLEPETIALFTAKQDGDSRRGLGFDKPETDRRVPGPTSTMCSPATFGHSGFTGTCVWADPRHGLVYVFLSNRVYPTMDNRTLIAENVRTEIQDEIYRALRRGTWLEEDAVARP